MLAHASSGAAPTTTSSADHEESSSLTRAEWARLEASAEARQLSSEAEPCPICLEDFRAHGCPQLITSCGHLFHEQCLKSFERFQRAAAPPPPLSSSSASSSLQSRDGAAMMVPGVEGVIGGLVLLPQRSSSSSSSSSSSTTTTAPSAAAAAAPSHEHLVGSGVRGGGGGGGAGSSSSFRACPVCRHPQYDTKPTTKGGAAHRRACAVRLQALARGVRTRTAYAALLRKWFADGGGDSERRRKYVASELHSLSDKLVTSVTVAEDSIDALLAASDAALALSHSVFCRGEEEAEQEEWGDVVSRMGRDRASPAAPALPPPPPPAAAAAEAEALQAAGALVKCSEEEWAEALTRARGRNDSECAICMGALMLSRGEEEEEEEEEKGGREEEEEGKGARGGDAEAPLSRHHRHAKSQQQQSPQRQHQPHHNSKQARVQRSRELLSCSHVFHSACIAAFERFNLNLKPADSVSRSGGTVVEEHSFGTAAAAAVKAAVLLQCPMCRAYYDRRRLASTGFRFEAGDRWWSAGAVGSASCCSSSRGSPHRGGSSSGGSGSVAGATGRKEMDRSSGGGESDGEDDVSRGWSGQQEDERGVRGGEEPWE